VDEKRISIVSDGPYGPSILFSDGSTEPVPSEDVAPPPLVGDINFEETRAGFEVWFSQRLVQDHHDLIEDFTDWLLEQPEIVRVVYDTIGIVQVKGVLSEPLRATVKDWWASRVEALNFGN